MAFRFILTEYDQLPNGDLIYLRASEVTPNHFLRMHGINPEEYWALSDEARLSVHTHMNAGIEGAEALAQVQSTSASVN